MKRNTGTYEYIDRDTGLIVLLTYHVLDASFDHEFGTEHKIEVDADVDSVLDSNRDPVVVDSPEAEDAIDRAFSALDEEEIKELIEMSDNADSKDTVGWQYLNSRQIFS